MPHPSRSPACPPAFHSPRQVLPSRSGAYLGTNHGAIKAAARGATSAWQRGLERCAASASFHYATLLALQTKVLWGIFAHRPLTTGDTVAYFRTAETFSRELTCRVHWSPLYTSFFGSFLWLGDAAFAITGHRVAIVVLTSLLVYEVLRHLLLRSVAWLLTAWWILLPTNHETLYEVHLFALAPVLATWLVLLRVRGARGRGVALACLLGITVLVRNEYVLALFAFGALAFAYDLRADPRRLGRYVAPLLVVLALVGVAYARSTVQLPELAHGLDRKHRLNIAQIYAFGYGQQNPDYRVNPWTDYAPLLEETFGQARPTLWEAAVANPRALAGLFLWNLRLVPGGLETALLGARIEGPRPGYAAAPRKPAWAAIGSLLLVAIWIAGGRRLLGPDCAWLVARVERHAWAAVGMASVLLTVAVVAVVQRPRPAFLFPLSVLAIAWTGLCLVALARARALHPPAWAGPVALALMLLLAPSYWAGRKPPRKVASYYHALETHRAELPAPPVGVAVPAWPYEVGTYLERGSPLRVEAIRSLLPADLVGVESITAALDAKRVALLLVDTDLVPAPDLGPFLAEPPPPGWEALDRGPRWALLRRTPSADEMSPAVAKRR